MRRMPDLAILQYATERHVLIQDELTRARREQQQADLIRAKFHGLVRPAQQQHNFPEIIIVPLFAMEDAQMNAALVMAFERWSHIALMNEQLSIRFGNLVASDALNLRECPPGARVELIQGIKKWVRGGYVDSLRHNGWSRVVAGKIRAEGGQSEANLPDSRKWRHFRRS